jgi:glycosyltransferase involved in cell wall biosynthesis
LSGEVAISVVVPLYNEAESLPELHEKLREVLAAFESYEIIFVDDGSDDLSLTVLEDLRKKDPHVRIISFRRNYGKSAALRVGFDHAQGRYIITLDADLQDDPYEIPNLLAKLEEGYDLISGWKKKRYDPLSKTIPSKFFNFVTGRLSGLKIHDFNCGLKAYRREVTEKIPVYGELHRFLPALAHWDGFRVSEIPVRHHPRKYGHTKFGVSRFISGTLDLVTILFLARYIKKPMHLFGVAGMLVTLIGFAILAYLTWGWIHGIWIGNRPLFFLGILLVVFGVQSFSLGLIGEQLARFQQDRRDYLCKRIEGFERRNQ